MVKFLVKFLFIVILLLSIEGSEMSSDDRSWLMRSVMSMDQAASVPYFYPRLFPLVCITIGFIQTFVIIDILRNYHMYTKAGEWW